MALIGPGDPRGNLVQQIMNARRNRQMQAQGAQGGSPNLVNPVRFGHLPFLSHILAGRPGVGIINQNSVPNDITGYITHGQAPFVPPGLGGQSASPGQGGLMNPVMGGGISPGQAPMPGPPTFVPHSVDSFHPIGSGSVPLGGGASSIPVPGGINVTAAQLAPLGSILHGLIFGGGAPSSQLFGTGPIHGM